MAMTAVVAFVGGIAGFGILQLDGNLHVRDVNGLLGNRPAAATTKGEKTPGDPFAGRAVNLLVMGSDYRGGENGTLSGSSASDVVGMRSDTTIIVHVAADRKSAELVSIPRDTMVDIPACKRSDGSYSDPEEYQQFNDAFAIGAEHGSVGDAAACTITTVDAITNIRIDSYVVVDFSGFVNVVNALGGVKICIPQAIDADQSDIHLPAGQQTLNGNQALGYARAREGVGDGSDTSRINRQQYLLSAIVQQITSENLLTNLPQLYQVLNAATKTLTTGTEIGSVTAMAGFAASLRNLDPKDVSFITAPTGQDPDNTNRLIFTQPDADNLFAAVAQDQPIAGTYSNTTSTPTKSSSSASSSSASPSTSSSGASSAGSNNTAPSSGGAQAATGSATTANSANPYGASTAQGTGSCPAGTP